MRSLICTGCLIAVAALFFGVHDMLNRTIPSMLRLAVASAVVATLIAFLIMRWTEKSRHGFQKSVALAGASVFIFFGVWIALWFTSEQVLIDYYLRTRGGGDTGYNYFYPGASGMGYAEGLSNPWSVVRRILWIGGIGSFVLSVPFGTILTRYKTEANKSCEATGDNFST
jgi:hypothetical protein